VAEPDAVVPMVYPEQVVSATVDPAFRERYHPAKEGGKL